MSLSRSKIPEALARQSTALANTPTTDQPNTPARAVGWVFALVAGAAALLAVAAPEEWPGLSTSFLLVALIAAVLAIFIAMTWRREGSIALLTPPLMASVVHFLPSYLVPILMTVFVDDTMLNTSQFTGDTNPVPWVNRTLALVLACAVAMWAGYLWPAGVRIADLARAKLARTGWIRREFRPNVPVLFVMLVISIAAFLIEVRLGVYGYSSDPGSLIRYAKYRSFLDYGLNLLDLGLFLVAMRSFDRAYGSFKVFWQVSLWAMFLLHLSFGILSGFKGQVIVPAVIIGVAYFISFRRTPWHLIAATVALIVIAYSVIEPFRDLRNASGTFQSNSLASITQTMLDARELRSRRNDKVARLTVARTDLIAPTSAAMRHADYLAVSGGEKPPFLKTILEAPVLAFVPRFVWHGKPTFQIGYWFATAALGQPATMMNSVGMGPISYFYYIGGGFAAVVGFFIIGIIMRVVWSTFVPLGAGGWIFYLAMLQPLATLQSEVGPVFVKMIQLVLPLLFIQWIALRPAPTREMA